MKRVYRAVGMIMVAILIVGCKEGSIPQRNVEFSKPQDVIHSYHDYLRLEKNEVETVAIKTRYFERTVSLAYYLYTIAQAFENFGRESDAKKLYVRLLLTYPLLHQGGQLGVMTENRLIWILGDKSWVMASVDELILRLEQALIRHDTLALQRLISRDFGFGRDYDDRFAVKYKEGVQIISEEFAKLEHPQVEVVSKQEDETIILKTSGWESGTKNWFFTLHKNHRLKGWEWDLAYWETAAETNAH